MLLLSLGVTKERRYSRQLVHGRHGIAVLLIAAIGATGATASIDPAGARGTHDVSHACKKKHRHHGKRHGRCKKGIVPAPKPLPPPPPPGPPLPPCRPCLEGPCPVQDTAIVCPPPCGPPCPPGLLCPLALTYPCIEPY
ncbi:MAG: hypothetical protein C5B48_07595 [Candidatus Rokuibacteriota bacterium]|nr:MAG: hypothetical protein C5B48_07595 [Candidatus Rokubacteria bacterium]